MNCFVQVCTGLCVACGDVGACEVLDDADHILQCAM